MTDFPHRVPLEKALRLSAVARHLDADIEGEGDPLVRRISPVSEAGSDALGLLAMRSYLEAARDSEAAALLVSGDLAGELADDRRPRIVVPDAHQALVGLLALFHAPVEDPEPGVHPTALVSEDVELADGVRVGAFAVIEAGVRIGSGSRIGAHAMVGRGVRIGGGCRILPQATLYPGAVLGDRVIVHSGARIAVDGFGYAPSADGLQKVPQVGRCILEDEVEVGANSTIDRGSIGDTRIGRGTKIDNLVQIGHNVRIGPHTVIAAQAGVAGSTRIGAGVQVGGQVGLGGHLTVGDGARLAGQAGVTGDVEAGVTMMGFPARPRTEFLRSVAAPRRVPELIRRVGELEARIEALTRGQEG